MTMTHQVSAQEEEGSATKVRQGVTLHVMRYVLSISIALAVVAMAMVWIYV